jgi:hypothetical protein
VARLHLPFDPLKVLSARLLALPIFGQVTPASQENQALMEFCSSVASVRAARPADPRLSVFLATQLASTQAYAQALPAAKGAPLLPLLARLGAMRRSVDCATCAQSGGGHQCLGSNAQRDDAQISGTGLCLAILHQCVEHVTARCAQALIDWGWQGDARPVAALAHRWGTRWPGPPQWESPSGDWKVRAGTDFLDDPKTGVRLAQIALGFEVDDLDWTSLLAVPWLVAHEFVCHVQQLPVAGAARQGPAPACPFFEGWMDEVASQLLLADLVAGWLGPPQPGFVQRHRADISTVVGTYRLQRYGEAPGAKVHVHAGQWKIGRDAARQAGELLALTAQRPTHPERLETGLRMLLGLSVRIQAATPTEEELRPLCQACLYATTRALDEPSARPAVLALLTGPVAPVAAWIGALNAV